MTIVIIEDIRNLIANDELDKAIGVFRMNCSEYTNELIMHSNKYTNLQTQIREGIISREQSNIERNRLCKGLLELLNKFDVQESSPKNINFQLTEELVDILGLAELISRRKGKNRTSTRDFFTALNSVKPNSLKNLLAELNIKKALPKEIDTKILDIPRSFSNNRVLSGCLTESLTELSKINDQEDTISTADMFIDVSKHGKGKSVAKLRKKGVGVNEINRYVEEFEITTKNRAN